MKYYIIAGEASGDLHASNLLKEIKKLDSEARFRCWGGDMMKAQGAELVKHYRELAFMGFTEVLMNLRSIFKNLKFCRKDISSFHPDVVILVDYPGFNLRMAKYAKQSGFRVFYYISPQLWAWNESRVETVKKYVDRMFVILPFEKKFYEKHGLNVDFTGHPLLDVIRQRREEGSAKKFHGGKPLVAILPGSRKQEIEKMLPLMTEVCGKFKDFRFTIAGVDSVPEHFYRKFMSGKNMELVIGETHSLLEQAHAALVTSGTATLETALYNVPQIVCYRGGTLSYHIAKRLVSVKYISLVNLILDEPLLKELIQFDFNVLSLEKELGKLLLDENYRGRILSGYKKLHSLTGDAGASEKTAKLMMEYLGK